ncbi:hypothetical protein BDY24DRAFT_252988 [Mrakia frigida]|uniref:uncharacterized protein n=1 Tax=Mrakia frigida TaxID=29902 RepID=UPI003FCC142D
MSLYEPFVSLLSSPLDPSKPLVPSSTLFPAISHFLSSLPRRDLRSFALALVSSPYLSSNKNKNNLQGLQDALRASVELKAASIAASSSKKKSEGGVGGRLLGFIWTRSNERELTLNEWIAIVLDGLTEEKTGEDPEKREEKLLPRLAGLAGLYQGVVGQAQGVGKSTKRELEVELLVLLEDEFRRLEKGKGKVLHSEVDSDLPPAFFIASSVFPLISPSSLRALDLRSIVDLTTQLLPSTSSTSIKPEELSSLTTVLSLSLEALAGSRSSNSTLFQKVVDDLNAFSRTVSPSLDPALAGQFFIFALSSRNKD